MKTSVRYLNMLSYLRKKLGLTQEQMAMQLGISTSMVKMVETNRRSLGTDKLAKLVVLENQLAKLQQLNKIELPSSINAINSQAAKGFAMDVQYLGIRCTHRTMTLKRQLKKMQREHDALSTSIHNLDALEAIRQIEDPMLDTIVLHRPKLLRKLIKCNTYAQEMMKKKIALLQAEAILHQTAHPDYVHNNEKPISSTLKQTDMDYTVSLISSRADCQAMIDMANDDKEALVYRKTGLTRQQQNANATSVSIDADLTSVTAEVSSLETIIAGLPEGTVKEVKKVELTKAVYKKFLLEQRKVNYGSLALVGKEYDIACIEQSITETDAFISALTVRLGELPLQ